jgi:hypothetical protein
MSSNQKHLKSPRISPRATSPRNSPILSLDEDDSLPKFIAENLLEVFKSNPNGTVSPNDRNRTRNILKKIDIKTLERLFDLAYLDYYKERLRPLNIKVENVKVLFDIAKINMKIQNVDPTLLVKIKEEKKRLETILVSIKEILMTTITKKYIQTLPYDAMVRQKNITEKVEEIENLLKEANKLIVSIDKMIKSHYIRR